MEPAIVDNRVNVVPETSATCVATVIEFCTVAGAVIGEGGVEVIGGKPRMGPRVEAGKTDWVPDMLT